MTKEKFFSVVLRSGLLVGLLDITGALTYFLIRTRKSPLLVFQYIASAVFGKLAYSGDWFLIIAGVLFHFAVAFLFTLFFFLIYPKISFLRVNKLLTAIVYGIFIWLVMNLLVLPLTRVVKPPFNLLQTLIGVGILILAIGIPLSWMAYKYYHRKLVAA